MKYFYIHPFKPQYFFPKGFNKHTLFLNFFNPYTKLGFVSWFLFRKLSLYRLFFTISNIEDYIPETVIRKIIGKSAILAFNRGSTGPEQKITALGIYNKKEFFVKYGQTKIAKANVSNEYHILKQLEHLDTVPNVLKYQIGDDYVLLKTSILKGERFNYKHLDKSDIDQLMTFSKQKINSNNISSDNLQKSFAHGDFCPWNMMSNNGKILVYDWEMAGEYSLGYDLFTYIFQTCFLLNPKIPLNNVVVENREVIDYYFSNFKLKNWKPYLKEFANKKLTSKQLRGNVGVLNRYKNLLEYAKEF
tara:strand:+ start:2973 stop:3881 length:909 start_codon:yes stop_codon:yes gene_type:complete